MDNNKHLLKGNEEKFDKLNVNLIQKKYNLTGNSITVGIIGFEALSHHNGAFLIQSKLPDVTIIEYNVMEKGEDRLSFEEAFQQMLDDNVDIVCCSLRKSGWNDKLEDLSKQLWDRGCVCIDSADNESRKIDAYPALSKYWFVSGAYSELTNNRAGYSQYGEKLDFLMYTNFACRNINGDYLPISHTSGTTQVSSLIVAMLKEYYGKENFTCDDFKEYIKEYCLDLGVEGKDLDSGYGLLKFGTELPERNDDMKLIFKENDTKFYVDGIEKTSRIAPYIKDGVMMMPMRELCEAIGTTVQWDENTKTVTIIK